MMPNDFDLETQRSAQQLTEERKWILCLFLGRSESLRRDKDSLQAERLQEFSKSHVCVSWTLTRSEFSRTHSVRCVLKCSVTSVCVFDGCL